MDSGTIFMIILVILISLIMITYSISIIIDKQRKIKYYKKNLSYEIDYDKFFKMIKRQKKIIAKKKRELRRLKFLVKVKRVFKWN